MSNRREFLTQAAAAGGVLALGAKADAQGTSRAAKPLRMLILGGTGNIGPHHVRAAVARGHKVSALIWTGAKQHAELPESVERLPGDRNGDLESIKNREWDAVLDLATYGPIWVRTLGEALKGRVKHYMFISTVAVYDKPENNKGLTDEKSPLMKYDGSADAYTLTSPGNYYGPLKVLCEKEAEKQFPGKTLLIRPGIISGPDDAHGDLVFWPIRMEAGGEVLASGESTPVQYIDVRDMADWIVRLIEKGQTGAYNAVGPTKPLTLGQVVNTARASAAPQPKITWVPSSFLAKQPDEETWGRLLFWEGPAGNIMHMSVAKAVASGLTTRPLSATLADTFAWFKKLPAERRQNVNVVQGLRKKKDGKGLEMAPPVPWTTYLKREKEVLAAWHAQQAKSKKS